MKKYKIADFHKFKRDELGYIICPTGNYSAINKFPGKCRFNKNCVFGKGLSFGKAYFGRGCTFGKNTRFYSCCFKESCEFGNGCSFAGTCHFGSFCEFGNLCHFTAQTIFGNECSFGDGCTFGAGSHIKYNCRFGKRCKFAVDERKGVMIGSGAEFGYACEFGADTQLGRDCKFGDNCVFSKECVVEYIKGIEAYYRVSGITREPMYIFKLVNNKVLIRHGKFFGYIEDYNIANRQGYRKLMGICRQYTHLANVAKVVR